MITLLLLSSFFSTGPLQNLHYVDLDVVLQGDEIQLNPIVRMLENQAEGEGSISRNIRDLHNMNLDGPIRQVISILMAFDENRAALFPKPFGKQLEVAEFEMELGLKLTNGSFHAKTGFPVKIGLEEEPGKGFVKIKKDSFVFELARLQEPGGYSTLLRRMLTPEDGIVFSGAPPKEFVADLYFLGPNISNDIQDYRRIIGLNLMVLTRSHHFKRVKTHLGSSYCLMRGGRLEVSPSEYLKFYGETLNAFSALQVKLTAHGPTPALIPDLEAYLGRSPTDVRAITALIEALIADDRLTDAYACLLQNRAFFRKAEHHNFRDKIEKMWGEHRYQLMDQRERFRKESAIQLDILSPKENDTLGGKHIVRFETAHPKSHFLCADLFLQDKKVGSISAPPFEIPIHLERKPRLQSLRLAVFFEDQTYREAQVDIKVLPIDDAEEVNLARLRAVVTKGPKKFVTDLKREDFELHQLNVMREIEHFRRDKAPLRVAILMDTSQSMTGKKLNRAQFAVSNFLAHLGPEDRVALYTFDQKVLRLSGFSPQYRHLLPRLFTLSPMLATSLHDAIYAAHRDLEREEGNKVMIVVSDGADTLSVTRESDIRDLFTHSRTLFYPILLYNNYMEKEVLAKSQFLQQLASMTGSVVYEVENGNDLNASFDQIYGELKSFYYMDFYSLQRQPDPSKIQLKARGVNTQVRFHIFDDEKPQNAWVSGSLRR